MSSSWELFSSSNMELSIKLSNKSSSLNSSGRIHENTDRVVNGVFSDLLK